MSEIGAYEKRAAEWRKNWARGEWDNEPNREEFEHAGLPCILQRGPSGAWCGYVGISPGHPLHGIGYSGTTDKDGNYSSSPVSDLDVHGGITYAEHCAGSICHVPKPGESEHAWWLGFDCAHSGDLSPKSLKFDEDNGYGPSPYETYKTMSYARRQTERLAKQLRDMTQGPSTP